MLVRNEGLLRRSKVYSWDRITKYTPRNIRPTDVEGVLEINRHFLWFEFKEIGVEIPVGQRLFFERILDKGFRNCLLIAEHEHLSTNEIILPMSQVKAVSLWMWDLGAIRRTDRMTIDDESKLGWWISQWCDHAEERPNHFVTTFRRRAGIYPESTKT